eukprot:TRINITY_DN13330_c0_g1_i2.p2 TRINITY_DN13330_c0_g1~~TRINITY_DN13330_c0_g1_i2.p2  ORF type:complete len:126 (-),score=20.30 TRINITY_DN13330_c0_g1_i2:60-437(-)
MKNDCGLLFTNKPKEEVLQFFSSYSIPEFATTGFIANDTIILQKGSDALAKFQSTMEPYFRKLGLHTSLLNAQIQIDANYVLCEKGKELTSEQTKLLKLLNYKLAEFKIFIQARWQKSGDFEKLL